MLGTNLLAKLSTEELSLKRNIVSLFFVLTINPFVSCYAVEPAQDQLRVLNFRKATFLGNIYWLPPEHAAWDNEYLVLKHAPFHKAGKAMGTVNVPKKANLFLEVGYDAVENPSLLTAYGPDFFTGLKFNQVETDDRTMAAVGELTGLKALDLRDSDLSDRGMESLSKLHNLEYLKLDHAKITDRGVAALSKLQALKSLQLDEIRITEKGLSDIRSCRHLRVLNLNHCQITDKGLRSISALSELEDLELNWNLDITAKGLLPLAALKKLKNLEVRTTAITAKDLPVIQEMIRQMPALHSIAFRDKSFTGIVAKKWQDALPHVALAISRTNSGDALPFSKKDIPSVFAPVHVWRNH